MEQVVDDDNFRRTLSTSLLCVCVSADGNQRTLFKSAQAEKTLSTFQLAPLSALFLTPKSPPLDFVRWYYISRCPNARKGSQILVLCLYNFWCYKLIRNVSFFSIREKERWNDLMLGQEVDRKRGQKKGIRKGRNVSCWREFNIAGWRRGLSVDAAGDWWDGPPLYVLCSWWSRRQLESRAHTVLLLLLPFLTSFYSPRA